MRKRIVIHHMYEENGIQYISLTKSKILEVSMTFWEKIRHFLNLEYFDIVED